MAEDTNQEETHEGAGGVPPEGESPSMLPTEDPGLQPGLDALKKPVEADDLIGVPKVIGDYRIVGLIGTGGMGAVYQAVQEQPRRRVAIKMMKRGIASRAALRRFEFESQLLARLQHPGIGQVYEAGTHDDGGGGVPYFVMEYIPNAKSLTDYADSNRLDTRERLELFSKVCDAVQHGHLKGIVHRDLKPGNILVDGNGQPKIIDFGIARSTDSDMALSTMQTNVGQLLGTLQYMSPEQCEADPSDIDARSDVYALGVILYELLTGELPYDVLHAAIHEAVRIVIEEDPARISTINRHLRGDIETIALKALEKNRLRRYQSAVELNQDIQHYLDDEPIEARPTTAFYRFKKFVRRNRTLAASTCIICILIIAGLIWTSISLGVISSQRNQLETTNTELLNSNDDLQEQFEASMSIASAIGSEIYVQLQQLDASLPVREEIAKHLLEHYESLWNASRESDVLEEIAVPIEAARIQARIDIGDVLGGSRAAYTNLGLPFEADTYYQQALNDVLAWKEREQNHIDADRLHILALLRLGDVRYLSGAYQQALEKYREALKVSEPYLANPERTEEIIRLASQSAFCVGQSLTKLGDSEGRLEMSRRGTRILEEYLAMAPGNPGLQRAIALSHRDYGFSLHETLLEEWGPERAMTEAMPHFEKSLALFADLAQAQPDNGRAQRDWGWAKYYIAYFESEIGNPDRGRSELEQGRDLIIAQLVNNPGDADARSDIIRYLTVCINLEPHLGGPPLAQDSCRAALLALQPRVEEDPENLALQETMKKIRKMMRDLPAATAAQ